MTPEQFKAITEWQTKTFGQSTPASKIAHLHEEINELYNELHYMGTEDRTAQKRSEFADCFILLFGAAESAGMSYEDIIKAIDTKMEINYKRKWGKPNENGVVNHIPENNE